MNELVPYGEYNLTLIDNRVLSVDKEVAEKIMTVLNSENPPKFIQVNKEMFATHQITTLIKESSSLGHLLEMDMKYHRGMGEWKCPQGLWHSRKYDDCSCNHPPAKSKAKEIQFANCPYCPRIQGLKRKDKKEVSKFAKGLADGMTM